MRLFNWFNFSGRPPVNGEGNGNGHHGKQSYEVSQSIVVESTDPVNAAKEVRDMVQSNEPEAQTYTVTRGDNETVIDLSTEPPTIA